MSQMLAVYRTKAATEVNAAVVVHLYRWRIRAYVEMRPNTWSEAILAKKEAKKKARDIVITLVLARLRGVFSDVGHWRARVLLQRMRRRAASQTAKAIAIRKTIRIASLNDKRQAMDQLGMSFESEQCLSLMTMKDDSHNKHKAVSRLQQKRIILARSMRMLWLIKERNGVAWRMREWQRSTTLARVQRVSATVLQLEANAKANKQLLAAMEELKNEI